MRSEGLWASPLLCRLGSTYMNRRLVTTQRSMRYSDCAAVNVCIPICRIIRLKPAHSRRQIPASFMDRPAQCDAGCPARSSGPGPNRKCRLDAKRSNKGVSCPARCPPALFSLFERDSDKGRCCRSVRPSQFRKTFVQAMKRTDRADLRREIAGTAPDNLAAPSRRR